MKTNTLYGFCYYGYDGKEEGREYFYSQNERNKRMKEISGSKKSEPFEIVLNKKNIWRLNYHGIANDKRKIEDLKRQIEELKKKLRAKIELLIEEEI